MKKLIGIVIASMMFANIGYAEMRMIEKKRITEHRISTWCVDGYKFIVIDRKHTKASSMFQFWEKPVAKTVRPAKC